MTIFTCQCCGENYPTFRSNQKYCHSCNDILPSGKNGSYQRDYVAYLIRNRLPTICAKCGEELFYFFGRAGAQGKYAIHHKDENRSNGEPNNLELLCQSCHMKTHNVRPPPTPSGEGNKWRGRHHNEEAKEKMRQAKLGKKLSEEHKEKLKKVAANPERRNYFSNLLKGRKMSEETKLKMQEGQRLRRLREAGKT